MSLIILPRYNKVVFIVRDKSKSINRCLLKISVLQWHNIGHEITLKYTLQYYNNTFIVTTYNINDELKKNIYFGPFNILLLS